MKLGGYGVTQQIKNRGLRIDQARCLQGADLALNQARRCNHQRHAHVLVIDEHGVSPVAFVLAKRLTVISIEDEQGVLLELAFAQAT